MAAASEDSLAVSFEHVQGLVPLTERSAAELLAGSAVQTGLSRHVFGSIAVIMENFKIFESEQELRRHPSVQGEWLPKISELMHVIRQCLIDVKFALGQNERKLRPLAEELDQFNTQSLTFARSILTCADYEALFQARHAFPSPEEQSKRNLQLRQKVALLGSEGDSASGSGSGQGSSESEIRRLRKRVKELENQLHDSQVPELRESEETRRAVSEENVGLQRMVQQLQATVNSFEYKSSDMESVVLDLEERNRKLTEELRDLRRGGRRSRAKKTAEEPAADQPLSQPGSAASTPRYSGTRAPFETPGEANREEGGFSTDFTRRRSAREPYDVRDLPAEAPEDFRRSGAPGTDARGNGDVSRPREAAPEPRATNRPPSFDQSYKKVARNQASPATGTGGETPVGTQTMPFGTPAGAYPPSTPLDALSNASERYPPLLELEPESRETVHSVSGTGHGTRKEADAWHDGSSQGMQVRSPPKPASWQRGLIQSIVKRTVPKEQVTQAPRDDTAPDASESRGRRQEAAATAFPSSSEPVLRLPPQTRETIAAFHDRTEPSRQTFVGRGEETSGVPEPLKKGVSSSGSVTGHSRRFEGPLPGEITFSSFIFGVPGGWEDQRLEGQLKNAVLGAVSGFDAFPSTTFSRFRGRANVKRLKGDHRPTFAFCDFASKLAKECLDDGTSRGRLVLKLEGWPLPVQKPRTQDMESVSHWERRALDDLWARARGADPAKTLYARFLGAGASATAVFEELLRTVVRRNAEGDRAEGIEEVLVAGKHAFVFLESESVGDELFRRLSGGDANLEQKLFICRRTDYVPAPGVLSEEQMVEDRTAGNSSGPLQRTDGEGGAEKSLGGFGTDQAATEGTSEADERVAAPSESGGPKLSESRRRQVWVGDLPKLTEPELSNSIQSAVKEAMAGFDVLPPASLAVHGATTVASRQYGFVEMSTVLGADLFVDAVNRGQIQAVTGKNDVLKVPRHQRWTMQAGAPPSEEQREQVELWREAETLNPAAAAYVRFTREFVPRKREQAVREEVERLAGTDGARGNGGSGIEKILCASKHAYVAFRSEGAADDFFSCARARGLEARLCFVRHRAYLPGPGMFVGFYAPESFMYYRKPATVASFMALPSRGLGGKPGAAEKGAVVADEQGFEDVPSKFEASPPTTNATSGLELPDLPATASNDNYPEVEDSDDFGDEKPPSPAFANQTVSEEGLSLHRRRWERNQREVFVREIPEGIPSDAVRSTLIESVNRFFSGYDALPRGLLDAREAREAVDSRTGARVAYVELASVLACQIVSDALYCGPKEVAAPLRYLRGANETERNGFIPRRQKWMLETGDPTAGERDALRAAREAVCRWDPRASAYARALDGRGDPDQGGRVKEAIRDYAGKDWDLEVVSVGRHAFVRFPDVAAADEFFDRPQEKQWDAGLFVCRHRAFLPAPALFLVPLPSSPLETGDAQNAEAPKPQVSLTQAPKPQGSEADRRNPERIGAVAEAAPNRPPVAKPPAAKPSKPVSFEVPGAADAAAVWGHDMYEAVYADGGGKESARAREKGEKRSERAGTEEVLSEGDGTGTEEGWGPSGEAEAGDIAGAWSESVRGETAAGWDGVSKGADDVSRRAARKERKNEAGGGVGWKKGVDRWTNPFAQLMGFEEEIVPPSSIHEETVRVRGGKTQKDGSGSETGMEGRRRRSTGTGVDEKQGTGEETKGGMEEGPSFAIDSKSGSGKGTEEEVESPEDLKRATETGWERVEHPGKSTGQFFEDFGAAPMSKAAASSEPSGGDFAGEDDAELFEDVPAGFEAEPERTGTPEWSGTPERSGTPEWTGTPEWSEDAGAEATGDADSLIGVGSFFEIDGSQAVRTADVISTKGAVQSVVSTGQSGNGSSAERGSGDGSGQMLRGTAEPSEFELSLKYVDQAEAPEPKQDQFVTEDQQTASRDTPSEGEAKPEAGRETEVGRKKEAIDLGAVRDEEEEEPAVSGGDQKEA